MRRSRCAFAEAHAGCLRAAHDERIAVLDALDATIRLTPMSAPSIVCSFGERS